MNRALTPLGLSLVQWDTLRHLHAEPEASLHRLAELTFQTGQSMGERAKRMIDRKLLERVETPAARSATASPTPATNCARPVAP